MPDNSQIDAWNGASGRAWAEHVDHIESMLVPFSEAVFERLDLRAGDRVVDLGCGVGGTTRSIAAMVAPAVAVGVDISLPMLDAARTRASAMGITNIEFRQHDVEREPLGSATFDLAFSRFGVMFFAEPERAFAHVHAALVRGGRLGFICFQGPFDNPMLVVPLMAAAAHVPMLPLPGPTEPGPFSLADPDRIRSLLGGAGFDQIVVDTGPSSADLGAADDLEGVARRALLQNPAISSGLVAAPEAERDAAIAAAMEAMSAHIVDGRIVMGTATWVVTAVAA
jgi:SAM-dependent methyltransferase